MSENTAMRLIGLLSLVAIVTGTIAGCAYSLNPLSSPGEGFVDPYLHGTWRLHEVAQSAEGLELAPTSDQSVIVVTTEEDKEEVSICILFEDYCCLTGHSTLLGAKKYFNLLTRNDENCDDIVSEDCPYLIFQYETFPSDAVLSQIANEYGVDNSGAEAIFSGFEGQLIILWYLPAVAVEEAIRAQRIEGESRRFTPVDDICINADSEALQEFFASSDSDLYQEQLGIYVRESFATD